MLIPVPVQSTEKVYVTDELVRFWTVNFCVLLAEGTAPTPLASGLTTTLSGTTTRPAKSLPPALPPVAVSCTHPQPGARVWYVTVTVALAPEAKFVMLVGEIVLHETVVEL